MDPNVFRFEELALKAALRALHKEPYDAQRRSDVIDCVTIIANALHRAGVSVETLIIYIRDIIDESHPDAAMIQADLVKHAIAQYHR
jgi:hypothetical protein